MPAEHADTIAATASKTTIAGAAASIAGWIGVNEAVAIGGFLLALIGLILNWHYRAVANARDVEKHREEMRWLRHRRAQAGGGDRDPHERLEDTHENAD